MKFTDKASIVIQSGNGGNGCSSFRRESRVPKGGPDGGNGGNGGSIIFKVSDQSESLYPYKLKKYHKANNGQTGSSQLKTGACGKNLILPVPPGTVINDENNNLLFDLCKKGEQFEILCGGRGGKGNHHFRNSVSQSPKLFQKGELGKSLKVNLKLKLIADIGLLGHPNAGKSTLISKVTNSKSKIDSYPFTTLKPEIGIVQLENKKTFSIADIPGLIEGAHKGKGLGHEFLSHLERTSLLVHVIDISSSNIKTIFDNYNLIQKELYEYDKEYLYLKNSLSKRKQLIVLNKIDLLQSTEINFIKDEFEKINLKPILISAYKNKGISYLINQITTQLNIV